MIDAIQPLILVIDDDPHGLPWAHGDELNPELVAFLGSASVRGAGA